MKHCWTVLHHQSACVLEGTIFQDAFFKNKALCCNECVLTDPPSHLFGVFFICISVRVELLYEIFCSILFVVLKLRTQNSLCTQILHWFVYISHFVNMLPWLLIFMTIVLYHQCLMARHHYSMLVNQALRYVQDIRLNPYRCRALPC